MIKNKKFQFFVIFCLAIFSIFSIISVFSFTGSNTIVEPIFTENIKTSATPAYTIDNTVSPIPISAHNILNPFFAYSHSTAEGWHRTADNIKYYVSARRFGEGWLWINQFHHIAANRQNRIVESIEINLRLAFKAEVIYREAWVDIEHHNADGSRNWERTSFFIAPDNNFRNYKIGCTGTSDYNYYKLVDPHLENYIDPATDDLHIRFYGRTYGPGYNAYIILQADVCNANIIYRNEKIAAILLASDAAPNYALQDLANRFYDEGYDQVFGIKDCQSTSQLDEFFNTIDNYEDQYDKLFFYINAHGNYASGDSYVRLNPGGNYLTSSNFQTRMNGLEASKRGFLVESCYSGGFVEDFASYSNTLAMSTSDKYNSAYGYVGEYGWFTQEFFSVVKQNSRHFRDAYDSACDYVLDLSKTKGVAYAYPQIHQGSAIQYYDFFV